MERKLRAIHSWLGVLILPWVVVIGLTGLYLNHSALVKSLLPNSQKADLSAIDAWPDPQPASPALALQRAHEVWPDAQDYNLSETRFRKVPVFQVETDQGKLSMVKATGHYWLRWEWTREFHAPDGQLLNRYMNWGRLFIRLHRRGWITRELGYWMADITATALVVFGATGIVLFVAPRLRRRRNRAARKRQQQAQQQAQKQQQASGAGS